MQEAFIVLARAKEDAERRLRLYESEGRKSAHKLIAVRHAIKELEQAQEALKYMNNNRTELVRLWSLVEQGSKNNVQVSSSTDGQPRRQTRSRRRRT